MKLIRGCEKRIYYLKNTGSSFFEEAYFVLKNDCTSPETKSLSLAEEADKIISESCFLFAKKQRKRHAFGRAALFSLGAAAASAVIGIVSLIIGIV